MPTSTPMPEAPAIPLTTADVSGVDSSGQFVSVNVLDESKPRVWARLAIGNQQPPAVGDSVLLAGNTQEQLFVIGLLSPPAPIQSSRIQTESGMYAERGQSDTGNETLRVVSADNKLLFEADPTGRKTKVIVPTGSLELTAAKGDLRLTAGGEVSIHGQSVRVTAQQKIICAVTSLFGAVGSLLQLKNDRMLLRADSTEVSTKRANVRAESAAIHAEQMCVTAKKTNVISERLESTADVRIEKSGSLYRTVTDVLQTQAGRLRTFVSGFSHFRSKKAWFSSEESFNIDGEKINLG